MTSSTAPAGTEADRTGTAGDGAGATGAEDATGASGPATDREALLASIVDEVATLLVTAKRTIHDAAVRFDGDVPPSAYYVLRHVFKHGPCTSGDVVRATGMDKSAVSRHVTLLREHDYVDVVPDATDGRVLLLTSTDRAHARLDEVRRSHRASFRAHVDGWSDADLADFATRLHRFNEG